MELSLPDLLLLLVPISPGVPWLVAGLSVTVKVLPSYELHLHFVTHLILSKESNSCFPEQMFTSISQNLFVPHSSHWSRKFSGRLQPSRSFYQHKLNLGVFIVNSYCSSYLILPPSYSVPGVKTWDFVAKGALKKKKQCCKSCRSVDHFSFIFCVPYNSIVHEIVSPVIYFARFKMQVGELELYLVSVAGDGHGLTHVDRVTKACIH